MEANRQVGRQVGSQACKKTDRDGGKMDMLEERQSGRHERRQAGNKAE